MNNNIYNYVLFHFTSFLQMTKKRNTSRVWILLSKLNPIEREIVVESIKNVNAALTTTKSNSFLNKSNVRQSSLLLSSSVINPFFKVYPDEEAAKMANIFLEIFTILHPSPQQQMQQPNIDEG